LVRRRARRCGDGTLGKSAQWPSPVIKLFLEQGTPEAMVAAADPDERCEAQYYLWHLLRDEHANSIEALRNAIKSCPKDFIEYADALAELKRPARYGPLRSRSFGCLVRGDAPN
jgi:hypothetical protein